MEETRIKVTEQVNLETLSAPDMLAEVFRLQAEFRQKLGVDTKPIDFNSVPLSELDTVQMESWIQTYADCIIAEGMELKDWTRWKHWSSQLGNKCPVQPGSADHIREIRAECADLLCFLVNACAVIGMSAEGLFAEYCVKRGINFARQESGAY